MNGYKLKGAFDAALRRSPAQPLFLWRASRRLVVLTYHAVTDVPTFTTHIDYITREMHPVSLDDVITSLKAGRSLPRRAVLISFDDGDRTLYDQALPLLRERGVPALAFVVAGLLGTDTPFWWNEVEDLIRGGATASGLPSDPGECIRILKMVSNDERLAKIGALRGSHNGPPVRSAQLRHSELVELERGGIAIGNHTLTHPCLTTCPDSTLRNEIGRAHDVLKDLLERAPTAFAYPNGDVDDRATTILGELGYQVAFAFDHRIGTFPPVDRYRISRVRVNSTTSPDRLRIIVSGLHPAIHHLLART